MKTTKIQRTGKQPAQFKLEDGVYSRMNNKGRWVKLDQSCSEHALAIRAAKNSLKTIVQRDESGVGHCWSEIDIDANPTEGGQDGELAAWLSEEKPGPGDTYVATNGMTYRIKP